jgi:hypothetical protein
MFVIYAKQIPQGWPMVEEAEREVLGEALERLDIDVPTVLIDGAVHHRVGQSIRPSMGVTIGYLQSPDCNVHERRPAATKAGKLMGQFETYTLCN